MEWYWWVLIAVGVVLLGILKLKVWNSIIKNRKKKQQEIED
jgi:hypothetical protein